MTLNEILAKFMEVEAGVTINSPLASRFKGVHRLLAPGSTAIQTPCVMHQYRRLTGSRVNGTRLSNFQIRVQLLIAPWAGQTDVWSEVAAAFDEALVAAFDADVMLSSNTFQRIDDEQTDWQPGPVSWNGTDYVGVEYLYKVTAQAIATIAA